MRFRNAGRAAAPVTPGQLLAALIITAIALSAIAVRLVYIFWGTHG